MLQLLIAALLVGLLFYILYQPDRETLRRYWRSILLWGGGTLLVLLVVTGRLHWLFAALAAAYAGLRRLLPLWPLLSTLRRRFGRTGPRQTGDPELPRRHVNLWVDPDTGVPDGDVLQGAWRGWRLSRLSLEQCLEVLALCERQDGASAALVRAYLDRAYGERWRQRHGGGRGGDTAPMTRAEARAILGVTEDADEAAIVAAHRRLMQKVHPDRGGSVYLASRVNAAKRCLLER